MSDFTRLVNFLTKSQDNPYFQSDTLVIAGNSLPNLIISAAQFCQEEALIQQILFVGGIGHGTAPLIANCKKMYPGLVRSEWGQLSEAEITQEIFLQFCSRNLDLLLEKNQQILVKTLVFLMNSLNMTPLKIFGWSKIPYYKSALM